MSVDTPPPPGLHAAILTFNSMRTIERTLASVCPLAARVIVVDSGSTDGTIDACRSAGAEVMHRAWSAMAEQRQFALEQCANAEWIIALDSDESIEPMLASSIRDFVTRDGHGHVAAELNRKLWFAGAWLHHAFQPEWRVRLVRGDAFRSGAARAVGTPPHDAIDVRGSHARLAGDLRHDSWIDTADMMRRMASYAKTSAEAGTTGGTLLHLCASPPAAFLKQYVLRRGFLDGWRGALVSAGAAAGTLMKHACIMERRARQPDRDASRSRGISSSSRADSS